MATAGAIKAGSAYVEIFGKDGKLVATLNRAAARVKAFGAAVTGIGSRMAGLGVALGAPLLLAARTFADMGSDMLDISQRIGVGVEALSELKFAAEQSGATFEDLEQGIRFMSRAIGSGGMSLDQRLEQVADEIAGIEDPAQRTARAMEIFGRGGTRLIPMLLGGAAGVRELRAEAQRLGLTMSAQDATAAEAFGDSLSALWATLKRVVFTVGGALAPRLQDAAEWLATAAAAVGQWINENRGLVTIVGAAIAALTGLGVALLLLGPAISAVGMAIGLVSTAITALGVVAGFVGSAIAAIMTPLGLVLLALDTLRGWLVTVAVTSTNTVSALREGFSSLASIARTTWGAVTDAIAAGDLQGAMEIAGLGLRVAWQTTLATLRRTWRAFSGFFIDVFQTVVAQLAQIFNGLWSAIRGGFWRLMQTITRALDVLNPLSGLPGVGNIIRDVHGQMMGQFGANANAADQEGAQINAMLQADAAREQAQRTAARAAADAADQAEIQRLREELERRAAEMAANRTASAERQAARARGAGVGELPEQRFSAAGSFSAFAAAGLGVGASLADRTARATEATARNTARIANGMGEAQFG